MADIDTELLERAVRWCAEAGRQTTRAAVKVALAPLSWDQLLTVRALLADPPPARPLGPLALADVARGAPADVAAEREREGRYGPPEVASEAPAPRPASRRGRKPARPPFVIKRASDRAPPAEPASPTLPLVEELLREEGRGVLERLVRRFGGRRTRLVEALAAGWRRPDGQAPEGGELDRLLAHHGMAKAYAIRERDEILHALRAAGGERTRAAAALGMDRGSLAEALRRLEADDEAERIRERRRRELRARGTLTQRTHLLLEEAERLSDLGLLEEFVADLAARLPDHVRALTAAGGGAAAELLGRSLSLDRRGVERLLQQTGVRLEPIASRGAARGPGRGAPPRTGAPRGPGPRASGERATPARTAPAKGAAAARPRGAPGAASRRSGQRAGARRPGSRPPRRR